MSTPRWANAPRAEVLQALLDEAIEPLLALDEHGCIVECNRAAVHLLRRERHYLIGKPFATCIELADRRRFRAMLLQLPRSKPTVRELGLRLMHGNAELAIARARLRLLPGPSPLVLASLDATTLPAPAPAPAPVRAEHYALERYLVRLPIGVIGLDHRGRVLFANGRARRVFGTVALRRGFPLPELEGSKSLRRQVEHLLTKGISGHPQLHELGDGRVVRVAGAAARDTGLSLLTIDDVSAAFQERRAENRFVRNAAHQLRTPLASMSTAIEVLQAGAKDDPQARDKFLAHLANGIDRLTRLTHALLVLARSQTGSEPLRLELVELKPLYLSVMDQLRPAPDVLLVTECADETSVLAERDLLEEALNALVDNAVRHTMHGKVTLRAIPIVDRTVRIEVEDSGEGILWENQEHVFEPFYRPFIDGEGFGLGLAIASEAIAAMGARLELDSQPQRGSRFSFSLPVAHVQHVPIESLQHADAS